MVHLNKLSSSNETIRGFKVCKIIFYDATSYYPKILYFVVGG